MREFLRRPLFRFGGYIAFGVIVPILVSSVVAAIQFDVSFGASLVLQAEVFWASSWILVLSVLLAGLLGAVVIPVWERASWILVPLFFAGSQVWRVLISLRWQLELVLLSYAVVGVIFVHHMLTKKAREPRTGDLW